MLCQDKVLKENWDFNRGELYMIDHKRGQRPRESTIEIAAVLWPEHRNETTKWFMVVPITLDVRGLDPETDVIIKDRKDIGRPYAARLVQAHMVEGYQLLSYVGRLSERSTTILLYKMRKVLKKICEANAGGAA